MSQSLVMKNTLNMFQSNTTINTLTIIQLRDLMFQDILLSKLLISHSHRVMLLMISFQAAAIVRLYLPPLIICKDQEAFMNNIRLIMLHQDSIHHFHLFKILTIHLLLTILLDLSIQTLEELILRRDS